MKHALNVALQTPRDLFNSLFSSFPKPLFQSETNCEAINMKRTSYYQEPMTPVIIHAQIDTCTACIEVVKYGPVIVLWFLQPDPGVQMIERGGKWGAS